MARISGPWILCTAALLTVVGCTPPSAQLGSLPPPNLNAPVISLWGQTPTRQYTDPRSPLPGGPVASSAWKPPGLPTGPAQWVPQVRPRAWKYIVVHHSDSVRGSAAAFDRYHKSRGWQGLGYDFVIGNGNDSRDGQIEVGFRWTQQKDGAHAGVEEYNKWGIGICLVGDFNTGRPTAAQWAALSQLTGYLMKAYHIPPDRVIGHRDCKKTDCPGRNLPLSTVRRLAQQYSR